MKAAAASILLEVQPATWRHLQGWTTTLPLATDSLQMRAHHGHRCPGRRVPVRLAPTCPRRCPATRPTGRRRAVRGQPGLRRHRLVGPVGAGQPQLRRPGPLRRRQVLLRQTRDPAQPVPGRAGRGHRPRGRVPAPRRRRRRRHRAPRRRRRDGSTRSTCPPATRRPDVAAPAAACSCTPSSRCCSAQQPPPAERAALDRAIIAAYRAGRHHRRPGHPAPPGPAAARPRRHARRRRGPGRRRQLAARLAPWVDGLVPRPVRRADHHPPRRALVVWSLRHLPDELRTVGTLLALDSHLARRRHPRPRRARPRRGGWSWSTRRGC